MLEEKNVSMTVKQIIEDVGLKKLQEKIMENYSEIDYPVDKDEPIMILKRPKQATKEMEEILTQVEKYINVLNDKVYKDQN